MCCEHRWRFGGDTDWIPALCELERWNLPGSCSCGRGRPFALRPAGRQAFFVCPGQSGAAGEITALQAAPGPPCSTSGGAVELLPRLKVRLAAPIRRSPGRPRFGARPAAVGPDGELQASVEGKPGPPPASFRCKAPTCCWEIPAEQGGPGGGHGPGQPAAPAPVLNCLLKRGRCFASIQRPLLPIHFPASSNGASCFERLPSSSFLATALGRATTIAPTATSTSASHRQRPAPPGVPPGPWMRPCCRDGSGRGVQSGLGHRR